MNRGEEKSFFLSRILLLFTSFFDPHSFFLWFLFSSKQTNGTKKSTAAIKKRERTETERQNFHGRELLCFFYIHHCFLLCLYLFYFLFFLSFSRSLCLSVSISLLGEEDQQRGREKMREEDNHGKRERRNIHFISRVSLKLWHARPVLSLTRDLSLFLKLSFSLSLSFDLDLDRLVINSGTKQTKITMKQQKVVCVEARFCSFFLKRRRRLPSSSPSSSRYGGGRPQRQREEPQRGKHHSQHRTPPWPPWPWPAPLAAPRRTRRRPPS